MFSKDYAGILCAHAIGTDITFSEKAANSLNQVNVSGSQTSFQINTADWSTSGLMTPSLYVSCDPNPLTTGTSTTCTASILAGATGTVSFSVDNGSPWASATVSSGSAVVTNSLASLSPGSYAITAQYSGDGTYAPTTGVSYITVQSTSVTTASSSIYSFSITDANGNSGYDGVSNVTNYTDSVNGIWTGLAYDRLNRISGGQQVPVGGTAQFFCWSYDSFGNRTAQVVASQPFTNQPGQICQSTGSQLANTQTATYNGNNQIQQVVFGSGAVMPSYDPSGAGNITYDGSNYYLYDAENRVCAVAVPPMAYMGGPASYYQYVYDAEGRRVAKGTINSLSCDMSSNGFTLTNSYALDLDGHQVTETDGAGNWIHSNAYAGGQLLATYKDDGVHFHVDDWLGSRRVQTDYQGRSN